MTACIPADPLPLTFHPVTMDRLPDLARFSQGHGKAGFQEVTRSGQEKLVMRYYIA